MSRSHAGLAMVLVALGAGWGLTVPLAKIAVSDGYRHFGIIFWQQVVGVAILGPMTLARGRSLRFSPLQLGICLIIALTGTLLPNGASYQAAVHLPAGIMAILIALVPMFAFPIALGLGVERFAPLRLLGLICGLGAVLLLVGPEASLPERAMVAFIPLALVAPFFYGVEGNIVARWGTGGLDPVKLLFGASVIGAVLALPVALASGHWISPLPPWGAPDAAIIASSSIHALVYAGYVWLVGRAGPVFAAQVAYLVTGFGIAWSMLLLGERYSAYVWAALGLILAGLFLVAPRDNPAAIGNYAPKEPADRCP